MMFEDIGIKVLYKIELAFLNVLGTLKDKFKNFKKTGIYDINCKDCNVKY